ncbi:MFS general substrate transporter [Thozetella sp. PMI_491]|nr:MFS general substrate transporter [Thozetella sp. PMI_491]
MGTYTDEEKTITKYGETQIDSDTAEDTYSEPALEYPEGGRVGWLVVFGSFCTLVSVHGVINSASVFESYFKENQLKEYSPSDIGWIFSSYTFVVYFLGIQAGPIFDRHGHRVLLLAGSTLMVIGPFILSVCTEYYQFFLAYSVLMGIGGAMINTPAFATIGHFFNRRRGLATGFAAMGGSVGGTIFPFLFQATFPRLGFPWSMRILGFIMLALAVPSNLLLRTRLPPATKMASVWPDLTVFRDPKLALCCAGIFLMEYGVLVPLAYIVLYATDHGQDAGASYLLPALLNAASIVGRAVPGVMADRLGRFNMIIMTVGLCTASVFAFWLPAGNSNTMLIVFSLLLGFASGGNVSLIPVCIGQLCDSRNYGRFLSSANMVASFGLLTGIPIGGALLRVGDKETGWRALILFSALSYAVSTGCYIGARVLAVGWKAKTKY